MYVVILNATCCMKIEHVLFQWNIGHSKFHFINLIIHVLAKNHLVHCFLTGSLINLSLK